MISYSITIIIQFGLRKCKTKYVETGKIIDANFGKNRPLHETSSSWFRGLAQEEKKIGAVEDPKKSSDLPVLGFYGTPALKEGDVVEGFKVEEVGHVPELSLTAARLSHTETGARYLHIYRDDDNNTFSVGFRTPPVDTTGLPYILQRMAVCGSARYPCRDPLLVMKDRSIANHMNPVAGPDYSVYPFSTHNLHDFNNLMSVYLDAVFRPLLKKSAFRKECWRLEHQEIRDERSPIMFKGTALCNLKKVFSDNNSLFAQQLLNIVLQYAYGHGSGGDPLEILKLTHSSLKEYHSKYYNPRNVMFYSYGNFSLADHLIYINQNYLTGYTAPEGETRKRPQVPLEARWTTEIRKHISCSVDPIASHPNRQSTIAITTICPELIDIQTTFELKVIAQLLLTGPKAEFYKALVEKNMGRFSPVTGYHTHTRYSFFTVGLQALHPDQLDKVFETYNSVIELVVEKGFDEKEVAAVLHGMELNMKQQTSDLGLGILFGLTPLWTHNGDLVSALRIRDQVARLRRKIRNDPRYLQRMVDKHLKTNPRRLILSMSPDEHYKVKQAKAETDFLESTLASLNKEDKKHIYRLGMSVLEEQSKSSDISALPTLLLDDLSEKVIVTHLNHMKLAYTPVQVCLQPTNEITYFRGIINTALSTELQSLVPLFIHVLPRMGTRNHNFRELYNLIRLKTGGLGFATHVAVNVKDITEHEEGILFSTYCMDENVDAMFELVSEINKYPMQDVWEDERWFESLVREYALYLSNSVMEMGHQYAVSCAAGLISGPARQMELWSGLSHVRNMRKVARTIKLRELLSKLRLINSRILCKEYVKCALNLSSGNYDNILKSTKNFLKTLPGIAKKSTSKSTLPDEFTTPTAVHHVMQIPSNYTAMSVATVPFCDPDFAPLRVLARLLTFKYLRPMLVERGGACGAGSYMSVTGTFNFYSYDDPNSILTFDTFDAANSWLLQHKFSESDINQAKLGVFQSIDSHIPPDATGMTFFLYGISDAMLQEHRVSVKAVTKEDLMRVALRFLSGGSGLKIGRAIIGPVNRDLFDIRTNEQWKLVVH